MESRAVISGVVKAALILGQLARPAQGKIAQIPDAVQKAPKAKRPEAVLASGLLWNSGAPGWSSRRAVDRIKVAAASHELATLNDCIRPKADLRPA